MIYWNKHIQELMEDLSMLITGHYQQLILYSRVIFLVKHMSTRRVWVFWLERIERVWWVIGRFACCKRYNTFCIRYLTLTINFFSVTRG